MSQTITVQDVNIHLLRRQRDIVVSLLSNGDSTQLNQNNWQDLEGLVNLCDEMLDIAEGFKS